MSRNQQQQQEMLRRPAPPPPASEEPEVEMHRRDFNRGGGGGGPFSAFSVGVMSTSTRTVCEPDPRDPTQQICKEVTERSQLNPNTGKMETYRSERALEPSGGWFGRGRAKPELQAQGVPAP